LAFGHGEVLMKRLTPRWRYRFELLARTLVAIVGGYVLAAAASALCAQIMVLWLGVARTSAVTGATMLAFVLHAAAAIYVFACASAVRACLGILIPALLMGLAAWVLAPSEGMVL